jgi:hypothetical protein
MVEEHLAKEGVTIDYTIEQAAKELWKPKMEVVQILLKQAVKTMEEDEETKKRINIKRRPLEKKAEDCQILAEES